MGFLDTFKGNQYKSEAEALRIELEQVKSLLTPEMQNAHALQKMIVELKAQKEQLEQSSIEQAQELSKLYSAVQEKKQQLISIDDELLFQEFSLYKPRFAFTNSEAYKLELGRIRQREKDLIKAGRAATGSTTWTVNGNAAAGKRMVSDTQKLLLLAFNCECDDAVDKVKFNNFDLSMRKITKSCEAIGKLGKTMNIEITQAYFNLKIQELQLAHEYQIKKQEEKEAIAEARAQAREEAKLQKEIEEQRRKAEKEQTHYENALSLLKKQIEQSGATADLIQKQHELESTLEKINANMAELDYREANQRAGYVYIISNIGAFGENIYKIGMTRRLDPQERVDELGDASVPFRFDVHAMIFSDNAPALEAALHHAFEDRKVNMVNQRREFFNVTLDEIKEVVKRNFDKTVDFIDIPDAEQYRISQKMRSGSVE